MRWFVALAILALGAAPVCAAGEIKIGVLNDQNGPQADFAGPGSVVAAQMAIEDFGGKVGDKPVVAVIGDHQNKADIGSNLARQWFDQDGVQVIVDVPNSAVALAVADIAKTKNKLVIVSGAWHFGSHGQELLAEHDPLDLRHLGPGQYRRHCGNEGG